MRFLKIFFTIVLIATFLNAKDSKSANQLEFDLTDINGTTYHIKHRDDGLDIPELKGKVVFLAFFGHRCPPCRMEIPGFINFTKDKSYAKKAVILALEVQGLDREGVKQFAKNIGINYIIVPGSENYNFIDYIGYRTKWNNAIPFMVVLDSNGTVQNFGNGVVSEEELKILADKLYVDNNTSK